MLNNEQSMLWDRMIDGENLQLAVIVVSGDGIAIRFLYFLTLYPREIEISALECCQKML